MRASKLLFAHKRMEPSIPIAVIMTTQIPTQPILFHPIQFEIAEGFPVPAAYDWETVFSVEGIAEHFFLHGARACHAEEGVDAGVVHPGV